MAAQPAMVPRDPAPERYTSSFPRPFALVLFHDHFLTKLVGWKFLRQSGESSALVEAYEPESVIRISAPIAIKREIWKRKGIRKFSRMITWSNLTLH